MTPKHGVFMVVMAGALGAGLVSGQLPSGEVVQSRVGYTVTEWGILATLLTALIGSIVGGVIAIIGALRPVAVLGQTVNTIAKDAEAIKGHVNSEKTAAEGRENTLRVELAAVKTENVLLRELLTKAENRAALLAQDASTRLASPAPPAPPAPPASIAAVADAAHTLSDALPTLDSIKGTGESTNTIVKTIDQKEK